MDIKKRKAILIISVFILLLVSTSFVIIRFWPRYEENFFEFGLLGNDKKAERYYPDNNSTLTIGSQVNWYVYIHNHMGSHQNVIVRIKILNSTMDLPDDRENKPSPYFSLAEFPLSLSSDEKFFMPFSWNILNIISQKNSTIFSILVNNQIVKLNVPTSSDSFYLMVFELWVQDKVSGDYRFGWQSDEIFSSASTYIWFKLNSDAD